MMVQLILCVGRICTSEYASRTNNGEEEYRVVDVIEGVYADAIARLETCMAEAGNELAY